MILVEGTPGDRLWSVPVSNAVHFLRDGALISLPFPAVLLICFISLHHRFPGARALLLYSCGNSRVRDELRVTQSQSYRPWDPALWSTAQPFCLPALIVQFASFYNQLTYRVYQSAVWSGRLCLLLAACLSCSGLTSEECSGIASSEGFTPWIAHTGFLCWLVEALALSDVAVEHCAFPTQPQAHV